MTVYEGVKKGIAYIESNLQNDIGVWDVASAVSYSQFYYSRQFSNYTHISIYEYILKRKLSESYKCLLAEKPRIVDLAVKYGFSSHEVFTRAFRKMFGQNPSDATLCKPLQFYESIDDGYLHFLCGLKIERVDAPVTDCFFEVDSAVGIDSTQNLLVLLSQDHRLDIRCTLQGRIQPRQGTALSFGLQGLKHKIRIHHSHTGYSLRYYFDHFHDPDAMTSNFILVKHDRSQIDIMVPE